MSIDIGDVLDRRSALVERQLVESRKQQTERLLAIRRITTACGEHENCKQGLWPKSVGAVTVQRMHEALHDGKHCDQAVSELRKSASSMQAELERINTQRARLCGELVSLRHKADFLRDRRKAENRKLLRRRLLRDLAGD